MTIDTLRADHVGCYGATPSRTPNLDKLAERGMRFTEARSHVPLTAPSHATILTGVLPPQHGLRGNAAFRLRPDAPALAEALRDGGYRTAAVVASVVLDRSTGLDRGFESYDDNQRRGPKAAFRYLERGASQIAESAAEALDGLQPPFFLWVHFYDPHVPWVAPGGSGYDDEIAFADEALGHVLDAASVRSGNNLIVVALADHGESLGEHGENQHGYTLHRGVLRVPLIVAGPGIPPGKSVDTRVGLIDVAPTIAGLAGIPYPRATGRSLSRFFQDTVSGQDDVDDAVWEETLHPLFDSGWAPLRGLLMTRWHFVDAPRPELYDRAADLDDHKDVAAAHPDAVASLRARLGAMGHAMGDVQEPEAAAAATPEEKERRERLAALGYASSGGGIPRAGRLDPKDGLPGFIAVEDAERLLEHGQPARAKSRVEPFLKVDPDNPRLWHTLSKARMALGDSRGAAQAIDRALALSPGLEFLRYTRAEILHTSGDEAGAKAELEAIVRDDARAVEASLELSAMAIRAGDAAGSTAILMAAYRAGARDPDLLDRLGAHAVLDRREADGRGFYGEALALWPDDPVALLALARSDLRANDAAGAIARLRRCTSGPSSFECRMELARAYVVGPRDLDAARRELRAARAAAPNPGLRAEIDQRLRAIDAMAARPPG